MALIIFLCIALAIFIGSLIGAIVFYRSEDFKDACLCSFFAGFACMLCMSFIGIMILEAL